MRQYMICGIDAHDKTLVCRWAANRETPLIQTFPHDSEGVNKLIARLRKDAEVTSASEIVVAYEASSLGFGLYDTLNQAGFTVHVLAPHKMRVSAEDRKKKTDDIDALRVLEELRGHYLAGNKLAAVWVPGQQTRDDRQLVRARLDIGYELTRVKVKIRMFLKANNLKVDYKTKDAWTVDYRKGLARLLAKTSPCLSAVLGVLIDRLSELERHQVTLDEAIEKLSRAVRYHAPVQALTTIPGVGLFGAMVFLTEMGEMDRFKNRRQLAAYLGLAPCSYESGNSNDRKGHITRQGSYRVRKILCQSVWCQVRLKRGESAAYRRIVAKNPNKKKVAVVACMRRLAIRMWHTAELATPSIQATTSREQAA